MISHSPKAPALLVLLVSTLLVGPLAPNAIAAPSDDRYVLSIGHTDAVAPHVEDGALGLRVKDDTELFAPEPVFRDPSEVIFHAKPESELTIPSGIPPEFAFLGEAGDSVWILPMTQDPELLWPGFSSETIPSGVLAGDELDWILGDLVGPGDLNLWVEGVFGEPHLVFPQAEPRPQKVAMPIRTHAHYSWGFGAPGLYAITFEARARSAGEEEPLSSGPTLYHFFVGNLAGMPEVPSTSVAVQGLAAGYEPGETVHLEATHSPATALAEYRWSRRCGEEIALAPLGTGPELEFAAAPADDGCEYFATLHDGPTPIAISSPALLRVAERDDDTAADSPPMATVPAAPSAEGPALAPRIKARLWLRSVRLQGRMLHLGVRLNTVSRLVVRLTRGGRTVAKGVLEDAAPGQQVRRIKLNRLPAPGHYSLRVRAGGGELATTKAVRLRLAGG